MSKDFQGGDRAQRGSWRDLRSRSITGIASQAAHHHLIGLVIIDDIQSHGPALPWVACTNVSLPSVGCGITEAGVNVSLQFPTEHASCVHIKTQNN